MAVFIIPVTWSCSADMKIEADSLEEALDLAKEAPFPDNWEYMDGSFEIDHSCTEELNDHLIPLQETP